MDRAEFGNRRRTVGTVNSTINLYGDRILQSSSLKKPQMDFVKTSSRAGELHTVQRDIGRYKERKTAAELVRAQAESELSNAKKTVKDLSLLIENPNSKAKPQVRDIEMLKKSRRREERALAVRNIESYQYADVMRELEFVKQELSKLKLDMAYVLEEKLRAEREIHDSSSKMFSYLSCAQALKKEIEKANEEQVLVELARIEALKEFRETEAQRVKEANEFSAAMEKTKQKMKGRIEEIDQSKELETKLAATLSDVDVLQSELKLVKEMDKKVQRNDSLNRGNSPEGEELGASPLEAAKKELALVREEGFQFMVSMDIIRNELKHVTEEAVRLKKTEEKADLTRQNLNSKLLRANAKLEAAYGAEEKAKSISSSLSLSLEQLKKEAETAEIGKELIRMETATIKAEILKTESAIDTTEERLQVAVQELEVVKSSEALALENLRSLVENSMRARASASQHSSKITISKFEYEYITGRAGGAVEIADKKVAAAHAWIEALKASEKEILIKTELAQRKMREMRLEEETNAYRTDESPSAKPIVEGGLQKWRKKRGQNVEIIEAENLQPALLPKSMKGNGNVTPSGGAKFQKSASRKAASPAARHINSFTIKKKIKVMPNLAKWFSGMRIDKDL
ncbi:protein PLASTID MOVEMENT IMPAIRED 2-like isoform X2 [Corylus avellana]|uniref:protein PLASTID MOVEMENT IMPAIRED 2-like isoform X2 n=1 Tax=Corylus avellana TaxID=13451 RepID=UPI001E1FF0CA|nr:protein PLASTID MOVEMENT IMPAIRED 2-like isoform X2 [Corylus avellana]